MSKEALFANYSVPFPSQLRNPFLIQLWVFIISNTKKLIRNYALRLMFLKSVYAVHSSYKRKKGYYKKKKMKKKN